MKKTRTDSQRQLELQSNKIREIIMRSQVPERIGNSVVDYYKKLSEQRGPGVRRSQELSDGRGSR